jgi:ferritin-like metal-binding protein YciE
LSGAATDFLRRCLTDAIEVEDAFESRLREFANQGDDSDVQSAFFSDADALRLRRAGLTARLEQLGGAEPGGKTPLSHLIGAASPDGESVRIQEEQTLHNLIAAFGIESSECALYEVLASVARAADDSATESFARQALAEQHETAQRVFSFLRSRSKIAFNMLTPNELDPAVETKAFQNRVV